MLGQRLIREWRRNTGCGCEVGGEDVWSSKFEEREKVYRGERGEATISEGNWTCLGVHLSLSSHASHVGHLESLIPVSHL